MPKKALSQTKIRDLDIRQAKGSYLPFADDYRSRITNLLMNAIIIECSDDSVKFGFTEETFVKRALFETGRAGYDQKTKTWLFADGENINGFGYPTQILLHNVVGKGYYTTASYEPNPDGAFIIYATPYSYSMSEYIDRISYVLGQCDASALQNILATKTPAVFVCNSDDIRLSVEQAIQQIQDGKPALVVSNELTDALKGIDTKTEYIADRIELYKRQRYDAVLNELGVLTSVDKAERVQSAEVNASIGECKDYISIWVDTFNRQCKDYDLPFTMRINNALEEIYPAIENMDKGIDQIDFNKDGEEQNDI